MVQRWIEQQMQHMQLWRHLSDVGFGCHDIANNPWLSERLPEQLSQQLSGRLSELLAERTRGSGR